MKWPNHAMQLIGSARHGLCSQTRRSARTGRAALRQSLTSVSLGHFRARTMKTLVIFSVLIVGFLVVASAGEHDRSNDYAKLIVGRWLGSRKIHVYHASGTWGIKRNEDAPEDTDNRRWSIKGSKLTLTYPGDHRVETAVY